MWEERRKHTRERVLRRGRIVFRNGHVVIDCVLLDISEAGALLKTSGFQVLPERFKLQIVGGRTHEVGVCFRAPEATGVRFLDHAA